MRPELAALSLAARAGLANEVERMLRRLLSEARAGEVVCLPPGIYRGGVVIRRDVTLVAAGDAVIEGDGDSALIVSGSPRVVLRGLVLRGGAAFAGGGIYVTSSADLTLEDCLLEDNSAPGYGGGAVYLAAGRLTLRRCRMLRNTGLAGGGVLAEGPAWVRASGCALLANTAEIGSALLGADGAELAVTHCTLQAPGDRALVCVRGTSTRAPALLVSHCVLDAAVPLAFAGAGPPSRTQVVETLLRGPLPGPAQQAFACERALYGQPSYIAGDPCRGLLAGSPGSRALSLSAEVGGAGDLDLFGRAFGQGDDLGAVSRPMTATSRDEQDE